MSSFYNAESASNMKLLYAAAKLKMTHAGKTMKSNFGTRE